MIDASAWGRAATLDPLNPAGQLDTILQESGSRAVSRNDDPRHIDRVLRLNELIQRAPHNDYQAMLLKEALSTSDFPILFGDILDRQLLSNYQVWPKVWPTFAKRGTVRDFRFSRRIALDGLNERWIPQDRKPELTGVPENDNLVETGFTVQVAVYERGFRISWQMMVNDDTGAFTDIAPRMGQGANRSVDYLATTMLADANGPHASLFTAGNKNIVNTANGGLNGNNPPLTINALQDAMTVLRRQRDPVTNEPIYIDMMTLVVPPGLEVIARNILRSITIRAGGYQTGQTDGGGTSTQGLDVPNWMREMVQLAVNPYLPVVSSTANGDRAWYLVASPENGRPLIEVDFLRGFEEPQLYQKAPNMMRLGGGLDPTMGDFETLSLAYKGILVVGAGQLDGRSGVASNGSGV